ncbi:hypothetical protein PspLS_00481 [Pyricularia sp. CBS 133598]|nr:hypothetical protein PspLS_00481 [Pyricularia sp. CBS 133598]
MVTFGTREPLVEHGLRRSDAVTGLQGETTANKMLPSLRDAEAFTTGVCGTTGQRTCHNSDSPEVHTKSMLAAVKEKLPSQVCQ